MNAADIAAIVVAAGSAPVLAMVVVHLRASRRERADEAGQSMAAVAEELPAEYQEWEQDDDFDAGAWTAFYPPGSLGPYPEQPDRPGPLSASARERRRLHQAVDQYLTAAVDSRP